MAQNFYPGDSTNLVKAKIQNEETKDSVEAYFNPTQLTVDKKVTWQKHKNSEGDAPSLEFTAGEPQTMSCELLFDMFEDQGDVYATYVKKLRSFALIDSSKKRPPMVTFTWGSNMPVFKGVIEGVKVDYTVFLPDGTPTRAKVTLNMKQASSLMNKKEAEAANKKEKEKKGKTAKGKTTVSRKEADSAKNPDGSPAERDDKGRVSEGTTYSEDK